MSVAVVVPWRGGCEHRERAWRWVQTRYADQHPDWEVLEGHAPGGPWRKALAVQDGIDRTTADIIVVADADVWCDQLGPALAAVTAGAPAAIPHSKVHRLTEAETARCIAGGAPPYNTAEQIRKGMAGGGIMIIRRDAWDLAPMDPRFEGWGQEDASWHLALTVAVGKPVRFCAPLYHLWHPPQLRLNRAVGSDASRALHLRYVAARASNDMHALLDEARHALTTRRPACH